MSHLIGQNSVVGLEYTLRDSEGNLIEERGASDPLLYLQGCDQILPAIEEALVGHSENYEVSLVVSPEDGYGEYDESLVASVERSSFPKELELEEGMMFDTEGPEGEPVSVEIVEINGDEVTVDGNHPLAGVELHFDLKVVSCRSATPEEIEHGHVHGSDGHHVH